MAKLTDKLVGVGVKPELSPNPDGSGYVKQVEIVSHEGSTIYFLDGDGVTQSATAEENVLYIQLDGRQYKYNHGQWLRVESGPNTQLKEGGRGTPVHENTKPKVRPRVFSEPVALQEDTYYKGKLLEDLIGSGSGGGEDSGINIVKFSDVALNSGGQASLVPTVEQWSLMADTDKECVVIVGLTSGATLCLNRVAVATSRIIFASQNSTTEYVEDATAVFIHVDGDGYYSGGIIVTTMLEANITLDDNVEYAELDNITVNGETYVMPKYYVHDVILIKPDLIAHFSIISHDINAILTIDDLWQWLSDNGYNSLDSSLKGYFAFVASSGETMYRAFADTHNEEGDIIKTITIDGSYSNFTYFLNEVGSVFTMIHSTYEVQ